MDNQNNDLQNSMFEDESIAIDNKNAIINTQINNGNQIQAEKYIGKQINHYSNNFDIDEYILKYKNYTMNNPIIEIIIHATPPLTNIPEEDKLFNEIEKFIYSLKDFKLDITFDYTKYSNYKEGKTEKKIIKDIEKFIFTSKKDFIENNIEKVNYTKFINLIKKINKYVESEYWNDINHIDQIQTKTMEFFRKKFLHFDKYSDKEFFDYLNKNEIDYMTKDFKPTNIEEFFNYYINNHNELSWDMAYEDLKDYDFEVMRRFLFTEHKYEKRMFNLKNFIQDNNYKSYMYEEIDGMNPWCLHNICELKSWNKNNSSCWVDIIDNEDVNQEFFELNKEHDDYIRKQNDDL